MPQSTRLYFILTLLLFISSIAVGQIRFGQGFGRFGRQSQQKMSFSEPKDYVIGGIKVKGLEYLDKDALLSITGLKNGDTITLPGKDINDAIKALWDQNILGDVKVFAERIEGDYIFLVFKLQERPRLSKFSFQGIPRGQANDLREKIELIRGKVVTEALVKNTQRQIENHYIDKGFHNVQVDVRREDDTIVNNSIILHIKVDRGKKVKIARIHFEGIESMVPSWYRYVKKLHQVYDRINGLRLIPKSKLDSTKRSFWGAWYATMDIYEKNVRTRNTIRDVKVQSQMKETKEARPYRIFKSSKFIEDKYEADKNNIISYYNKKGYRDAEIVHDSVYTRSPNRLQIDIKINEGKRYYFRNIYWKGNYLYSDTVLSRILNIKKGDVYNKALLDKKLNFNPTGPDISSLYLDDGYLFFNVTPVEVAVVGDSIDIEMQIYEGSQAYIDEVRVAGNTKTSDHVIRREIRTLPGQKFSRQDIIRTQRELSQLGYFDPEKMGITPEPDPANSEVDINYDLTERPSDQLELSGGYGGGFGLVGTLGITFNNFSARKMFDWREWRPLPSGDGQRISARVQANPRFQLYNFSFTEPWLGGRKPNSFTIGINHSRQSVGGGLDFSRGLSVTGVNVSLGRRLKWPDDFFSLSNSLNYQRYTFNDLGSDQFGINIEDGHANNFNFQTTLSRNSIDNPLFPTRGSSLSLSGTFTPPYSLFGELPQRGSEEEFRFIEYNKWMFDAKYYLPIRKNVVLATRAHYGFLASYGTGKRVGPFDRFKLGGSGIAGFNFILGTDIIALRGYDDNAISPNNLEPNEELSDIDRNAGGVAFAKYVTELRVALSRNPAATVWVHGFLVGGNNWSSIDKFNPFEVYRSMGLGARIFMPAFGLMGIDYGFGMDDLPYDGQTRGPGFFGNNGQFHFIIGQQIR